MTKEVPKQSSGERKQHNKENPAGLVPASRDYKRIAIKSSFYSLLQELDRSTRPRKFICVKKDSLGI